GEWVSWCASRLIGALNGPGSEPAWRSLSGTSTLVVARAVQFTSSPTNSPTHQLTNSPTSPQRLNHRQPRRPSRREESSDHAHHDRKRQSGEQELRRHAERKGDLAEARPVGGAGDDAIDRQREQTAEDPAEEGDHRRLGEEAREHAPRVEAEREQHRD